MVKLGLEPWSLGQCAGSFVDPLLDWLKAMTTICRRELVQN